MLWAAFQVNQLFDAMDVDKNGNVSKFELLEWLREHRYRPPAPRRL